MFLAEMRHEICSWPLTLCFHVHKLVFQQSCSSFVLMIRKSFMPIQTMEVLSQSVNIVIQHTDQNAPRFTCLEKHEIPPICLTCCQENTLLHILSYLVITICPLYAPLVFSKKSQRKHRDKLHCFPRTVWEIKHSKFKMSRHSCLWPTMNELKHAHWHILVFLYKRNKQNLTPDSFWVPTNSWRKLNLMLWYFPIPIVPPLFTRSAAFHSLRWWLLSVFQEPSDSSLVDGGPWYFTDVMLVCVCLCVGVWARLCSFHWSVLGFTSGPIRWRGLLLKRLRQVSPHHNNCTFEVCACICFCINAWMCCSPCQPAFPFCHSKAGPNKPAFINQTNPLEIQRNPP